jgi:hypothetical protein
MIRFLLVILLLLTPVTAKATTCSQANSECEAKGLLEVITGAPTNAEGNAKTLLNVVTNPAIVSNAKLILNVVLTPGTPPGGAIVTSPLTHFK